MIPKINGKTTVTIGFLIALGTFLTPAIGSLKAVYLEQAAHAEMIKALKQENVEMRDRQNRYDEDLKKILEGIGEIKGQLKHLNTNRE